MIRRALGCWRTVVAAHVVLLAFATLLAVPGWLVVRTSVGSRPDGDLALWHEGSIFVADTVAHDRGALAGAARATALGTVLFALLSLPISAGLFATLRHGRDLGPAGFGAAAGRAGAFLVLLLLWLVAAALVAGAGFAAANAVHGAFEDTAPVRGTVLAGLCALPFAALLTVLAAATDVARSAVAAGRPGPARTLLAAARAAVRSPLRFTAPYCAFGAASIAASLLAAALADRLGGRPGASAVALFVIGQLVLLARAFLRAAWMAAAAGLAEALPDHASAATA